MTGQGQAAPPRPDAPPGADWQRLDRRTVFVTPLMPLLSVAGVSVLVVLLRGWDRLSWEPLVAVGVALALLVGNAWRWATTRYRVTGTHVELHSGMVFRRHRALARDRIRAVDMSSDVFHRLFGLSSVTIGTGMHVAEADDVLKLEAVSVEEADRLRGALLRRAAPPAGAAQGTPAALELGLITRFSPSWLRYAPLTFVGFLALAAIIGGLLQLGRAVDVKLWETGPVQALFDWYVATPLVVSVPVTAVVVLVLTAVLSVVVYAVLYWGFELTRQDDGTLRVQYGLVTKRSVSLEERKLRGVQVDEPLLLRATRGGKVKAVATGLAKKKGDDDKWELAADLLLPHAPATDVDKVTAAVLGVDRPPTAVVLRRHPAAAARRLVVSHAAGAALPAVVLGVLSALDITPAWPWQLALVLLPLGALLGVLEYRGLGHALAGDFLLVRWGATPRHTVALRRGGVIGWNVRQSVLQRRAGLVTVGATTAAGSGVYLVRNAGQGDGLRLADAAVPGLLAPFLVGGDAGAAYPGQS